MQSSFARFSRYFGYDHLPINLQAISRPFHDLAVKLDEELPDSAEKTAMFRKLLEAKDCAVRASLEEKTD